VTRMRNGLRVTSEPFVSPSTPVTTATLRAAPSDRGRDRRGALFEGRRSTPFQEKKARPIPIALYPKLVDLQIHAFGFTPKLVSACRNLTTPSAGSPLTQTLRVGHALTSFEWPTVWLAITTSSNCC